MSEPKPTPCPVPGPGGETCAREAGHGGAHHTADDSVTWPWRRPGADRPVPDPAICNARAPDNPNCWCALNAGHEGPHGWEPRHPTPAVAHPCRTPDPASGALCHLPAGHTGAHQAPGHVWEPAPIIVGEAEQRKAARRRDAAAKGARTVKARRAKAKDTPAEAPPPAPDNGRPVCPKCGKSDRILFAGEGGLSAPMEEVPAPGIAGGKVWQKRPLKLPDDAFCDRCCGWFLSLME